MSAGDVAAVMGSTTGVLTLMGGFYRWGVPFLSLRRAQARARLERDMAIQDVLLGRPAGEPNPVTGEPAIPALPSIGDRLVYVTELAHDLQATQAHQTQAIHSIATEVKNTSRITAVEEIIQEHGTMIRALHKQVNQLIEGSYERRQHVQPHES